MYFRSKSLCKTLNRYEKIIIYGTGKYAHEIFPQLVENGLVDKVVCFTQTEKSQLNSIDGIPVIDIQEINHNKTDCVVLIAVSELYVDEIKQTLLECGYPNIVSLIDYWRTVDDFSHLVTFEEYCKYISDWYVETHRDGLDETAVYQKLLERGKSIDKKTDSKLIVMLCGNMSQRIIKIIGALKRKKYNIVMLIYGNKTYSEQLYDLQNMNVPMHKCQCIEEMFYEVLQYYPLVYFFEPCWGDCLWAEIMLKNKKYFGKISLTLYDVLNDGYIGQAENNLATEKYALEHADGIVWRWFSKEYLEKKGFRYQGKSIQFIDYCNNEDMEAVCYNSDSSVIRLCEVVGIGDSQVEDRLYNTEYNDFARLSEILEKIGNRQDCIFHFYAGYLSDKSIECCRQYEKKYNNFRFFVAAEHDEMLKRLKDYDFGCYITISGKEPPDDAAIGGYYGSCMRNSIRNVYFDYLSAGLPVITTHAFKLWEYLSAYNVVIKMDLSNLDIDYLKQNRKYYKDKVEIAREELNIDNQIQRLIDFFKEL